MGVTHTTSRIVRRDNAMRRHRRRAACYEHLLIRAYLALRAFTESTQPGRDLVEELLRDIEHHVQH